MKARLLVATLLSASAKVSLAEMLIDPASVSGSGRTRVAGTFAASEVEYETDNTDSEIERKILGAELAHGVAPDFDLVGQLGLVMESEVENLDEDGEGYAFGFGARGRLYRSHRTSVLAYGLFALQAEEFDGDASGVDWKLDVDTQELHLGTAVSYAATPNVLPYVALDLIIYDDGEAKASVKLASQTAKNDSDIERDDIINLKIGANIGFSKVKIRPEATFVGEQTFAVSLGTEF